MRGSRTIITFFAVLAVLTSASCSKPQPPRDPKAEAVKEIQALETEAGHACKCEQRGGPGAKKGCWAKFEAAISPKQTSEGSTMCMPVYEDSRCWTADGKPASPTNPEHCMTTAYHAILFRGGEALLCTEPEAKAAEAAWNLAEDETLADSRHPDVARAKQDAADAAIRSIAHGERFVAARTDTPGCI